MNNKSVENHEWQNYILKLKHFVQQNVVHESFNIQSFLEYFKLFQVPSPLMMYIM